MRGLIAAACIAIVAFVGYFFWGEFGVGQVIRDSIPEKAEANDALSQFERSWKDSLDKMPDGVDEIFNKPKTAP